MESREEIELGIGNIDSDFVKELAIKKEVSTNSAINWKSSRGLTMVVDVHSAQNNIVELNANIVNKSLSKEEQTNIRRKIFKHLDGIAIGSTMKTLKEKEVFMVFEKEKQISLNHLLECFGGNIGYFNVALRLLICQGWMERQQNNGDIKYQLTKKGQIAVEMASAYKEPVSFIPMAMRIEDYLFRRSHEVDAKIEGFLEIVEKYKRHWDLPVEIDAERNAVREQILNHLDGFLIGPIMVAFGMRDLLTLFQEAESSFLNMEQIQGNKEFLEGAFELLATQGWLVKKDNHVRLTPPGYFAMSKAYAYAITVSYLPTFEKVSKLLFDNPNILWQRTPEGHETHVNRKINVWGSGKAHQTYFKKIDEIIIEIFNLPLDEQPLGIADIGCGDGSFMKHLYEVIKTKTQRGNNLDKYPLVMIGADYNQAAREAARETLTKVGISHSIVFGDINNPDAFAKKLWQDYQLRLEDILSVRSFLDHNRPYTTPDLAAAKVRRSSSTAAFAYRGKIISNQELIQNLVEHFSRWAPYAGRFGLLILELHTIPPEVTAKCIGKTLATAFDATHGYSDQYPVEFPEFIAAVREAGLVPDLRYQTVYPSRNLAAISVNLFRQLDGI